MFLSSSREIGACNWSDSSWFTSAFVEGDFRRIQFWVEVTEFTVNFFGFWHSIVRLDGPDSWKSGEFGIEEMTRSGAIKVIISRSLVDKIFGSTSKKRVKFYACYLNFLFPDFPELIQFCKLWFQFINFAQPSLVKMRSKGHTDVPNAPLQCIPKCTGVIHCASIFRHKFIKFAPEIITIISIFQESGVETL